MLEPIIISFVIVSGCWYFYRRSDESTKERIINSLGATYIPVEERTRFRQLRNFVRRRQQMKKEMPILLLAIIVGLILVVTIGDKTINLSF